MTTRLDSYYYIAHIDNLKDILSSGIYSRNKINELGLQPAMISNPEVMEIRKNRVVIGDKTLWDYANVYFQARNPMLWTIIKKYGFENIVVLRLSPFIHKIPGAMFADGNAAKIFETNIFPTPNLRDVFRSIRKELGFTWWNKLDGSFRKIMAEALIPDRIDPSFITSIYVVNSDVRDKVLSILDTPYHKQGVITSPKMFFQGETKAVVDNVSILEGDMFFSGMKTLTISVNTIGVMGKGLASRAKHQFPDVFDYYKGACDRSELKMGTPVLYKRTSSINEVLGSDYIEDDDEPTWFLLFPTKTHFMYNSDKNGIEKGLIWIRDNYKDLGIKSLALPALGCGLGKLSWNEIGPLMVKYLRGLEMDVSIYLPAERRIPDKYISREFLLND